MIIPVRKILLPQAVDGRPLGVPKVSGGSSVHSEASRGFFPTSQCCKQLFALMMDAVFPPDMSASGLSLVCELHSPRVWPSQGPLSILRFTWMSLGLDSVFSVLECSPVFIRSVSSLHRRSSPTFHVWFDALGDCSHSR